MQSFDLPCVKVADEDFSVLTPRHEPLSVPRIPLSNGHLGRRRQKLLELLCLDVQNPHLEVVEDHKDLRQILWIPLVVLQLPGPWVLAFEAVVAYPIVLKSRTPSRMCPHFCD